VPLVAFTPIRLLRPPEGLLVPEPLNVAAELLIVSGALADSHADDLLANHARVDSAVDSASTGWVGRSAAALSASAAAWTSATRDLATRVCEHGAALRITGATFAEMELRGARATAQVHRGDGAR
jgi:hypothetical protein